MVSVEVEGDTTGSLMLHWTLGPRASAISLHIDFVVFFHSSEDQVLCKGLCLLSRTHQLPEKNVPLSRPQDGAASRDLPGLSATLAITIPPRPQDAITWVSQPQAKAAGNLPLLQAGCVAAACWGAGKPLQGQVFHELCATTSALPSVQAAEPGRVIKAQSDRCLHLEATWGPRSSLQQELYASDTHLPVFHPKPKEAAPEICQAVPQPTATVSPLIPTSAGCQLRSQWELLLLKDN